MFRVFRMCVYPQIFSGGMRVLAENGLYGIRVDERVVLGSYFPFSVTGRVVSAAASTCSE